MTGSIRNAPVTGASNGKVAASVNLASLPPAARPYQGERAGVVSRVAAAAIDAVLLLVVMVGLYVGIAAVVFLWKPRDFTFPSPSFATLLVIAGGLVTLYLAVSWEVLGRTYGNNVLGLRVVSRKGGRLTLGVGLLRAVLCVLFPFGLLWAAINQHNRSVQDLVLRTSVIYDWIGVAPTAASPNGAAYRSARSAAGPPTRAGSPSGTTPIQRS